MSKSPGHEKWPDHKVQESPMDKRVTVAIDGQRIADSSRVVRVEEDHHPVRYYFPRADVRMDLLERSDLTTQCPFKGTAHYFHVNLGGHKFEDAIWTYEDPYDEHQGLRELVAFYDDKVPALLVRVEG